LAAWEEGIENFPPQPIMLLSEKPNSESWQGRKRPISDFKILALVKSVMAKVIMLNTIIIRQKFFSFLIKKISKNKYIGLQNLASLSKDIIGFSQSFEYSLLIW
jgi:hypothetical protein